MVAAIALFRVRVALGGGGICVLFLFDFVTRNFFGFLRFAVEWISALTNRLERAAASVPLLLDLARFTLDASEDYIYVSLSFI